MECGNSFSNLRQRLVAFTVGHPRDRPSWDSVARQWIDRGLCCMHCSKSSLRHTYGANLFDFAQRVCAQWPHCNAIRDLGRFVEFSQEENRSLRFKLQTFNTTTNLRRCRPVVGRLVKRTRRGKSHAQSQVLPRVERGVEAALQRRGIQHLNRLLRRSNTFPREIWIWIQDGEAGWDVAWLVANFFPFTPPYALCKQHVTHFADAQKIWENTSPLGADLEIVVQ